MSIFVNLYDYLKGEEMGIVEDVKKFLDTAEQKVENTADEVENYVGDFVAKEKDTVEGITVGIETEVDKTVEKFVNYVSKVVTELENYVSLLETEISAKTIAKAKAEAALKKAQSINTVTKSAVIVPAAPVEVSGNTSPTT